MVKQPQMHCIPERLTSPNGVYRRTPYMAEQITSSHALLLRSKLSLMRAVWPRSLSGQPSAAHPAIASAALLLQHCTGQQVQRVMAKLPQTPSVLPKHCQAASHRLRSCGNCLPTGALGLSRSGTPLGDHPWCLGSYLLQGLAIPLRIQHCQDGFTELIRSRSGAKRRLAIRRSGERPVQPLPPALHD
jgi:hypothetical protein